MQLAAVFPQRTDKKLGGGGRSKKTTATSKNLMTTSKEN